jgi:hypothetical protein
MNDELRDEELQLAQLLQQMQTHLPYSSQSLQSLRSALETAQRLIEERHQSLLSSRTSLLEGYPAKDDDELTGLPGKVAFQKALERVFATGEAFSVTLDPRPESFDFRPSTFLFRPLTLDPRAFRKRDKIAGTTHTRGLRCILHTGVDREE